MWFDVTWTHTTDAGLLRVCLSAAVSLRIEKLRREGGAWQVREAVDPLASHGDALLRRTRGSADEPGTAETFNRVALAVAVGAFQPGGVHVFGAIWCAEHSPCGELAPAGDDVQRNTLRCEQCVSEGQVGTA